MHVLKLLVTKFILGTGVFSPRLVTKFVHASLEMLGRVKLRSVKFSPRQVTKLVHGCLGIDGSRVHTRVGEFC
jgi:hypothetical protein